MHVIDSHTGGQPTRVIIDGGPDLGAGTMTERKRRLAEKHDDFRQKSILEPKCADAMVGALLCEPQSPESSTGVIFFNNSGYLDMCGHGTIGLIATLAYLDRIEPGLHLVETPAGTVRTELLSSNTVMVENVASYCLHKDVVVETEHHGQVSGSVAWGGNWFFLADEAPTKLSREYIPQLEEAAKDVRRALNRQSITGADGAEIDHVEFFEPLGGGDTGSGETGSRNFVLCPGLSYDRSPCGTGTSAKLACLAETGSLAPGAMWIQESIIGSRFTGSYRRDQADRIIPSITGDAFVYADSRLIFQSGDPFMHGIK